MSHRPWCRPCRRHAPLYIFVGALVLTGAGFGFFLVDALSLEQRLELAARLEAYRLDLIRPGGADAAEAFRDSFLFYARWLGLIWLLGLSVIGVPGVLALDFMKGVLMGFTAGLLVKEMDGEGMLCALAALVPHNALAVPALMVASVSALRFAGWVAGERLLRRRGRLLPPLRSHGIASLAMLLPLCGAALTEAYLTPRLLGRLLAWLAQFA
ncbi:MAG TPA: stage II sporulation protein M [Paenibacillaceae bacterium]